MILCFTNIVLNKVLRRIKLIINFGEISMSILICLPCERNEFAKCQKENLSVPNSDNEKSNSLKELFRYQNENSVKLHDTYWANDKMVIFCVLLRPSLRIVKRYFLNTATC